MTTQHQHFLLKWNNHRSNMINAFESLLQSENLVDVTLAVEGKFLKAHKIVLSACSPYFQSMFVNQSADKHPILIFHDLRFAHLKTLLEFMYRGEISIDEKDLSDILKVAEALSIRGLSSFESDDEGGDDDNKSSAGNTANTNQNQQSSQQQQQQQSPNVAPNNNNSISSPQSQSSTSSSSSSLRPSSANNNINQNDFSSNSNEGADNEGHHNQPNNSSNNKATINNNSSSSSSSKNILNNCDLMNGDQQQNNVSNTTITTPKISEKPSKKPKSQQQQQQQQPAQPKKRGRKPIKRNIPELNELKPDIKNRFPAANSKSVIPSLPKQGVRRRLPRKFSGNVKREKLSEDGKKRGETDEFFRSTITSDVSEPLSEMSVRGLDLFKYASIEDGVFRCIECEKMHIPKTFKNKYSFQRHAFLYHEGNMRKVFPCPVCSREFSRPDKMKNHLRSVHENNKKGGNSGKSGNGVGEKDKNGEVATSYQTSPSADSSAGDSNNNNNCDF